MPIRRSTQVLGALREPIFAGPMFAESYHRVLERNCGKLIKLRIRQCRIRRFGRLPLESAAVFIATELAVGEAAERSERLRAIAALHCGPSNPFPA
jgi:hypothetical protein